MYTSIIRIVKSLKYWQWMSTLNPKPLIHFTNFLVLLSVNIYCTSELILVKLWVHAAILLALAM